MLVCVCVEGGLGKRGVSPPPARSLIMTTVQHKYKIALWVQYNITFQEKKYFSPAGLGHRRLFSRTSVKTLSAFGAVVQLLASGVLQQLVGTFLVGSPFLCH